MPYRLMKPIDFDPDKSYPVIVSLHGAGGRGSDNLKQLRDWNEVLAEEQRRTDYPSYILAPQSEVRWNSTHLQNVKDIINDLPAVDTKRIYVLGHSMGGGGTYTFIQSDPNYFAAAAPSAGRGGDVDASVIKDIPIWIFYGDKDRIEGARIIFAKMQKMGGNMKFTTWVGDGHGVAVKMITGSDNGSTQLSSDRCDPEPVFLKWLFAQKLTKERR
jgi:predicted peptidase